ncbi:MAG: hypothetical protein ACR2FP_06920, partial [Nocardioidaceae bacterium]
QPFGTMPARFDPGFQPSTKVAIVFPGAGYSPAHPLLEFGRQSLLQHGWTVQQVWWDRPNDERDDDLATWVCDQARAAVGQETGASRLLLLAKSLGTLASPVAAEHRLDAIWLTPLFDDPQSIAAIAQNSRGGARQLLVGGSADPSWNADGARDLGCEVLDLPGVNHFGVVPDDVIRSVEVHLQVTCAVEAFLTRLDEV